ncbi:hypothetical protein [Acinetobacter silvestris]|uniref:Uncharacterized protein n=1 Tax=Acinetobacter silvestris TaxID=1977882 RepID=A0A1Y3CLK2_9GAMM|nr:hypothetical protein [Acinetobacter silvestris]OTG67348.1 hypothetical protein B9T28_01580 [Acinetobacter silvestris]
MAMRPEVRRRAFVLMAFAVIQWGFVLYILNNQLFGLVTTQRILLFCLSCFGGGFLLFGALLYMVLKGNNDNVN